MYEEGQMFAIALEACIESGNIGASSDQKILHELQNALKRPISEICEINDQVTSTFSKQGVMNLDSEKNIDQIALEINDSKHINSEFLNFVETCSSIQESMKILITGEHTTNMNISRMDKDGNVAHVEEFKGIRKFTVPDTATLPGPSCMFEYDWHSNLILCPKTIETISPLKREALETVEKKTARCSACKQKEMSEHFEVGEEKNLYNCCQCKYSTEIYESFVLHISNHSLNPFYCNACKGFYSDWSLHYVQWECNVCKEYFACKGQLEDHYFSHEDHHKKYCRICQNEIVKHTLKEKERTVYKCCEPPCLFESNRVGELRSHFYSHSSLKVYKCNQCGKRYFQKQNLVKHSRTPESCY